MTSRAGWGAVALLILVAPVLTFPAMFGEAGQWKAAGVAVVASLVAVFQSRALGRLSLAVAVLAICGIVAWVLVAEQVESIDHFAGLALGLLVMSTIASWSVTRERLLMATMAFILAGTAALGVGARSVMPVHGGKALFGDTTVPAELETPLPLERLHARTSVSRNALAALALMVLPVTVAVASSRSSHRMFDTVLKGRVVGLVSALVAFVTVVLMQSRSAWLAAAFLVWLCLGRWVRHVAWWVTSALVFLAIPVVVLVWWGDHAWVIAARHSIAERVEIWRHALEALRGSPWIGIGFDYFRYSGYSPVFVWPDQIVGRPHAHNFVLQTTLDVGLIGLTAYIGIVGFVLRDAWRLLARSGDEWVRRVGVSAALSLISVHVYGVLDAVALGTKVGLFQWLVSGLVLAAARLHDRGIDG